MSAPVTAASHVTLSRCHEDVTPQHPPHSRYRATVSLAHKSEEASTLNAHFSIYFQSPSRPISALQLFPTHHSRSLHEEAGEVKREGTQQMTSVNMTTMTMQLTADWCRLLGLLVKSKLTINWWLVAGGWWLPSLIKTLSNQFMIILIRCCTWPGAAGWPAVHGALGGHNYIHSSWSPV